jgi:hypothetical protein
MTLDVENRQEPKKDVTVVQKKKPRRPSKVLQVTVKGPRASACELPILWTLSRGPEARMQTKKVVEKVISTWFELDEKDRKGRYPASRRKITESIVKFAKKNLVLKGQLFAVDEEGTPLGVWRINSKGMERALKEKEAVWIPKYSFHNDAIIIEKEGSS